jgi:hypothetical protein
VCVGDGVGVISGAALDVGPETLLESGDALCDAAEPAGAALEAGPELVPESGADELWAAGISKVLVGN